jgi:NhaA family Na+:H+ antiporter
MSNARRRKLAAPARALPDAGRALLEFLRTEAGGGVVLLAATLVALVWANSPWRGGYHDLLHHEIAVGSGSWAVRESVQHWINDAFMAVFFFVVGLEIKRELVCGELNEWRAAALPAIAAGGGMVLPAIVFRLVAGGGPEAHGWGIPMATDIAFAVGVLAVLGSRVPRGLKVFVLTLAIVDDIGAIVVIAVFYTDDLEPVWLLAAGGLLAVAVAVRWLGLARPVVFLPIGVGLWYCTYRSGIHPTIAGVALGLLMPVSESLETRLHPWSSYVVIPLFALANAGVALGRGALSEALGSRLTWAVVLGLVAGKVIGIAGATAAATRLSIGQLPDGVGSRHVLGAAALGGIGFTVSLFITGLAYADEALRAQAKVGILVGSVSAALFGAAILRRSEPAPG